MWACRVKGHTCRQGLEQTQQKGSLGRMVVWGLMPQSGSCSYFNTWNIDMPPWGHFSSSLWQDEDEPVVFLRAEALGVANTGQGQKVFYI